MGAIVTAINNLIAWFSKFPGWLLQLAKDLLSTVYDLIVDVFCFILDMLLKGVGDLLALIDIPQTSFNANQYLAGAPAEFLGMMVAIRIPEAFAIIVIALGIRFLLQLIPLIRLGS